MSERKIGLIEEMLAKEALEYINETCHGLMSTEEASAQVTEHLRAVCRRLVRKIPVFDRVPEPSRPQGWKRPWWLPQP